MSRHRAVETIQKEKVIAILRLDHHDDIVPTADALVAGGIRCLEVTTNTPGAFDAVSTLTERYDDVIVGMGTVLNENMAHRAVQAGAAFLLTPTTEIPVIEVGHEHGAAVGIGAFTPTEMHRAHRCGADFVKVFPAKFLDPGYLQAVKGPLPELTLLPTGGIGPDNAKAWLSHGGSALGVGSALTPSDAIAEGAYDVLTERAQTLLAAVGDE